MRNNLSLKTNLSHPVQERHIHAVKFSIVMKLSFTIFNAINKTLPK
jgi:hypothetical protein